VSPVKFILEVSVEFGFREEADNNELVLLLLLLLLESR
jgi:hypothetical protein